MNRKVWGIGLVVVLIVAMVGGLPAPVKEAQASPGTIWVPDNYTTIQAAVNNATSGDTIIVKDGTYKENVDVNVANLTIQSENGMTSCIVSASNPNDHVFYVTADWVNITGLTVRDANGVNIAGINLNATSHCNISGNNVTNNSRGIFLRQANNNTLTSNTAYNNTEAGIYLYSTSDDTITGNNVTLNGDGLYMSNVMNLLVEGNTLMNNTGGENGDGIRATGTCNDTVIRGNNISYNNFGIDLNLGNFVNFTMVNNSVSYNPDAGMWLENTSDSTVEGNEISNATGASGMGIYLRGSSNNNLTSNALNNSWVSIYLEDSDNNNLTSNNASNNVGGIVLISSSNNTLMDNNANSNNVDGIYLYSSSSNNLTSNTASSNDYGIHLDSSSNNTVTSNNASNNYDRGIYLDSSSNNLIYNNYFNNTNNAYDDGTNAWNITKTAGTNIIGGPYLGGNYWSDYTGSDTSHDGLGDTLVPYNSTGNITTGGDYSPLVLAIYATIEGTVYEANASVLAGADVALKCGGTQVDNTTTNASGYYNFTVDATCNYTVNVTKGGLTYAEKWANVTALGGNVTCDFKGMDAPYPKAPDGLYCMKCSNLWLYGASYPEGFALNATRVSDVLYAWTHPS